MARPPLVLNLWRNPTSLAVARIVTPTNINPAPWSPFRIGDSLPIQFNISDGQGNYETLTGRSYRVGMGGLNNPVTGGQFTISDNTTTSAEIPYNATAATIQLALNSMNGNAGPNMAQVYVTGGGGAPFKVIWQSNGVIAALTVNVQDLSPVAVATITQIATGSGSTPAIQLIQIVAQPYALTTSWSVAGVTYATGEIVVNTGQLNEAIGEDPSLPTYFEIEENDGSGDVSAIVQAPVNINGPALPASSATVYTQNSQTFNTTLIAGSYSYAITFPQAFSATPTKFLATISFVGTPTENLIPTIGNATTTGCTVYLNGAPSSNCVLTLFVAL